MSEKTWTTKEIQNFAKADDFQVSPFYADGITYGTPTWIWSVVTNGKLFIRAWNGQNSSWYNSAIKQKAGRVFLDGLNHEVIFKKLNDNEVNTLVDQEYEKKYRGSAYLPPMVQAGPKSSTIEVIPR